MTYFPCKKKKKKQKQRKKKKKKSHLKGGTLWFPSNGEILNFSMFLPFIEGLWLEGIVI